MGDLMYSSSPDDIVIGYTIAGDANMDSLVNNADVQRLDGNSAHISRLRACFKTIPHTT
jgi:hypothetical protein